MTKIYITWEELEKDTKELSQKIKASGKYNRIVAVSRGGLIPAGIVSYELELRNVETVNVSSYDDDRQRAELELLTQIEKVDEKTIIIDDLSDTGNTFRFLRKKYPLAKFATVYVKPRGEAEVDIFARRIEDKWVVFPWD